MANLLGIMFKNRVKAYSVVLLLFMTLGVFSCEHDIDHIVEQESTFVGNRLLTISAMLPPEYTNSLSRLILEDDEGGIKTRWEKDDDELLLFLENGTKQHTEVAHIKSLFNDNRVADFEIKIPEGWVGKCNIYGMLQKSKLPESGLLSEQDRACCRTLEDGKVIFRTAFNQCQFSAELSSNPAFWFKHEGIEITSDMSNIHVDLQHLGYLVAMHVENNASSAIYIPTISLFTRDGAPFFLSDGFENIGFEVKTGKCISVPWTDHLVFCDRSKALSLNTRKRILPGNNITLYHWFASDNREVPELSINWHMEHKSYHCREYLKKRLVEKGMVYHIYLKYDGSELKLSDVF